MDFDLETIRRRSSVRSFDGSALAEEESEALRAAFSAVLPCPFGGKPRFLLLAAGESGLGEGKAPGRIGTYGLISGAPAFIVGALPRASFAMEDFGYAMEGLVLEATRLGLGSCWIGGIFDRGAAARALGLGGSELLPAVLAIGRPARSMSLAERFTRASARAGTRKAPEELFFEKEAGKALELAGLGPWAEVLEAVRLGPSASNKQPWRLLRGAEASVFHLFLDEDRLYNKALGEIHIQNLDMGIAMRHFEAAARSLGLPGAWGRLPEAPAGRAPSWSYIASWLGA